MVMPRARARSAVARAMAPKPTRPSVAPGDLAADQALARPFAGEDGVGRAVGAAAEHEHGGDDVFGDRDGVAAGRGQDGDAAVAAGAGVDVVEPDAEAADGGEIGEGGEESRIDARTVAHDEPARAGAGGEQAVAVVDEGGVVGDGEARLEPVDGRLIHELRDDDVRHASPMRRRARF
jgi:hypothetical protein